MVFLSKEGITRTCAQGPVGKQRWLSEIARTSMKSSLRSHCALRVYALAQLVVVPVLVQLTPGSSSMPWPYWKCAHDGFSQQSLQSRGPSCTFFWPLSELVSHLACSQLGDFAYAFISPPSRLVTLLACSMTSSLPVCVQLAPAKEGIARTCVQDPIGP